MAARFVILFFAGALSLPAVAAATLDRIRQAGVVVIGYRDNAIPFSFISASGKPVGYTIEICQAIVEEVAASLGRKGLRVEYRRVTPTNRVDQVVAGRVDLECGSTSVTDERSARVAFSPIIFSTGTR